MTTPDHFYRPTLRPVPVRAGFTAIWKALILAALLFALASFARAQSWADSNQAYRGSQLFVATMGAWDAIDTARGVHYWGERNPVAAIFGRHNAAGATAMTIGIDAAVLAISHEFAKHGHRRWGTALNTFTGSMNAAGVSSWAGSCYSGRVAVPSSTHVTYRCR